MEFFQGNISYLNTYNILGMLEFRNCICKIINEKDNFDNFKIFDEINVLFVMTFKKSNSFLNPTNASTFM